MYYISIILRVGCTWGVQYFGIPCLSLAHRNRTGDMPPTAPSMPASTCITSAGWVLPLSHCCCWVLDLIFHICRFLDQINSVPIFSLKKKSTNKLHLSWRLNHLQVGVTCPWALFWSSSVKPVIVASDQGFRFHVALEKMVNRDLLGDKKGHSWKHLDFVGHFQPCDFDDLFRWGLMPC